MRGSEDSTEVGRYFLGIPIPAKLRTKIARIQDTLDSNVGFRWVPPQNLHITLRFLGKVETKTTTILVEQLHHRLKLPSFYISLGGLGAFPSPQRSRVIWLGVLEGNQQLCELETTLQPALSATGFEPPVQPFKPHITLARLRRPTNLISMLNAHCSEHYSFQVDQFLLYRSYLGHGPVRYEICAEFGLTP